VRQQGDRGGGPRVLHRQPHRRTGDERLADSEDRHANDTARIDPRELGRNYPNVVSLCGDAKVTLQKLIAAAGDAEPRRAEWIEQVQGYVAEYWAESDPLRTSDAVPIRPERIAKDVGEWLPADAMLVCDTFHAAIWTAQMSRLKAGQRSCAVAVARLGVPCHHRAKAALPDTPVIGFAGDAGFYYHMAELETAARLRINLVMVVNNNYSGGVIENARFEKAVNFAKVADSMGCVGFRVEKAKDIKGALDKALAAGKPAIVEILGDAAIRAKRGWVPAAISGE
jgi:acetolactate synthase-1/2/3 large subunit